MTIENEVTANGHSNGDGSRRTSLTTSTSTGKKTDLIVFDFDETIVNCNSDTYIKPLANSDPGGLSAVYDSYYDDHDWTVCMRNVFAFLHKIGIRKEDYRKCLAQMPLVAEMKYLFDRLEEHRLGSKTLAGGGGGRQYEAIIISDANTFFIEVALEQYRLKQLFRKVFTNGTSFDSAGCLQIEPYHHQNWCKLSGRNLCKGHVLKEYIANRASDGVRFDRISYVGDGANDLCPSLRLSAADLCFPRQGYPLHKLVSEKVKSNEMKAKMCPFTTGADIWNVLNNNCH